jgi:hypothetical protein
MTSEWIEHLICEAMAEVEDPVARKLVMEDVVGSFLAQIKKITTENPGVKFGLVQPMSRPKYKWFMDLHEDMCKFFADNIKDMRAQNVARIEGSPGWTDVFTTDKVHLTEPAGKVFVEAILTEVESFFSQEIVDLEDGGLVDKTKETKWIAERILTVEKEIARLNQELRVKEKEVMERRFQDSLVTSRIREEIDFIANAKKEDRIIITGRTRKTLMPVQGEKKKKWLNGIVGEVLDKIEPDASKHILFASQWSRNQNFIPLVEVTMDSKELALRIRKQFTVKKPETDFGRIFVANSVTLGTRVMTS